MQLKHIIHRIRSFPKPVKAAFFALAGFFLLFIFLDLIFPLRINKEYSTVVVSRDSTIYHAFLTSDDKWRMYTGLPEISPQLKKALIFKEDKYFYYHPGINPVAVVRALANNIITGRRTSGASTITMQVARLLKPKARTYGNKIIEMFRALQLEWHYSKDEILQLYLNLVPYGSNIEGVKSAAVLFFDKSPNHLSLAEIATLTIIPNRPSSLRLGENNNYIREERNKWLKRYADAKLFDDKQITDALDEPLNAFRSEAPKKAPHISYRLQQSYPHKKIIYSTIDMEMQSKVQKITKSYSQGLYFQNIKNASAIVINNQTREVLAYIGSPDFFNDEAAGQVDGIRAIRSPGSTLKPLLYGMAFDNGLLTPKTVISDVPTSFGGYEPENYDGNFYGQVTIEHALANSLNVPAVKVLSTLGTNPFFEKLEEAGFTQVRKDKKHLGLSAILGGCGATLEALSGLFCAFANAGQYAPLQFVTGASVPATDSLLSEESVFMLTEILTQLTRPDLPLSWQNSAHLPKVAWKTGTSYGRRDAWSIGYNQNYTVGVWVGNFSGEGVPELSGAEKAAPLLFRIFNAIDYDVEEAWYTMPRELGIRFVCSESGLLPNDYCNNQVMDYFIPGISPSETCHHLKTVFVNPDSTMSYCRSCLPEAGYIKALYPNLPPEIITYYDDNAINYMAIPPHNPDCERLFGGSAPKITSPVHENDYFIDRHDTMQIMLKCNAANDVNTVYWYINKRFYKSCAAGEKLFFHPPKGRVQISCSDDKGRNTDIWIRVKYISF